MVEKKLSIHNDLEFKVQAQIFVESSLVSTTTVEPSKTCILPTPTTRYDIYLKNSATGWEVTRKLDIEAISLTLSVHKGRYTLG